MKLIILVCVYACILLNVVKKQALAQLPQDVTTKISSREASLTPSQLDWNVSQTVSNNGVDPSNFPSLRKQYFEIALKQAEEDGVTDHVSAYQIAEKQADRNMQLLSPYSVTINKTWQFTNDGSTLLVVGENQNAPGYIGKYAEYYGQEYGLAGNVSGRDPNTKALVSPSAPQVWACNGDAARFRNAFSSLFLNPEDFTMLVGKNPLLMYDAKWQLINTTGDSWVMGATINEGNNAPFTVRMTLSRQYEGLPILIEVNHTGPGAKWSSQYLATNFKRVNNVWICSEANFTYTRPHAQTYKRTWSLKDIQPAKMVMLSLPKHFSLTDFRLLGPNLNTASALDAQDQSNTDVMYYRWGTVNSKLPSISELRKMQQKLHPGEASPDPKQASSLPFIGGLMMLVGGVWMFRRRGGSSS